MKIGKLGYGGCIFFITKIEVVDMRELPKIIEMALKTTDYIHIGRSLANEIREGGLETSKEARERTCSELNCSLNQYYAVLNILKECNFIRKEGTKYVLTGEFPVSVIKSWLDFREIL